MIKKKLIICFSNELGPKIINLLKKKYDLKIFTTNKDFKKKYIFTKDKRDFELKLSNEKICYEFIILIYWPFLIKKKFFNKFTESINFHPSYLPYLRGWYPHVHAKIRDLTWGVTLHAINSGIDTGNIWAQKKIKVALLDDNTTMYQKAKDELFKLFKLNYSKIINKKIKKKKQNKKFKFLKKKDVMKFNNFNLKKKLTGAEFLKLFLSRSFKNKSFINMKYKNIQYNLKLLITKTT